jgi:hypothetical protein
VTEMLSWNGSTCVAAGWWVVRFSTQDESLPLGVPRTYELLAGLEAKFLDGAEYFIVDTYDRLGMLMLLLGFAATGHPLCFDCEVCKTQLLSEVPVSLQELFEIDIAKSGVAISFSSELVSSKRWIHSCPHGLSLGLCGLGSNSARGRSWGHSPVIDVDFGTGFLLIVTCWLGLLGFLITISSLGKDICDTVQLSVSPLSR